MSSLQSMTDCIAEFWTMRIFSMLQKSSGNLMCIRRYGHNLEPDLSSQKCAADVVTKLGIIYQARLPLDHVFLLP